MTYEYFRHMEQGTCNPKKVFLVGNSMHQIKSYMNDFKMQSIFQKVEVIPVTKRQHLEGQKITSDLENITLVILLPRWFTSEAGQLLISERLLDRAITREIGDIGRG